MCKTIDGPKARPDVGCTELLDVLRASLARGLSVVDSPVIKHLVELPMTDSEYKRFIYFTSNASLSLPRDERG